MNKYLLLRNNKQSGPYTVSELVSQGLKAYDLVWLEGKSAAWRYPSEIEELKAFAPVVEEQPFDRFYKKPNPVEIVREKQPIKTVIEESPKKEEVFIPEVITQPVELKPAPTFIPVSIPTNKKVHVSLPGSAPMLQAERPQPNIPVPIPVTEKSQPNIPFQTPLIEKPAVTPSYNLYKIEEKKSIINSFSDEKSFEERYREEKRQKEGFNEPPVLKNGTKNKFWMRAMAASFLLLAGVLLGFVMNNNRQKSEIQELNELVKQIKQKEKSVPATSPVVYKPEPVIEVPTMVEEKKLVKKESTSKIAQKSGDTVEESLAIAEAVPTELPAAMPGTCRPVYKRETSPEESEVARKNLYQLVSVDHNKFKTGVFGGISNLQLKLSNKSLYQLEKVEVEVKYYGPEKKLVNTQTVYFENVSAGEQLTLDVPKSTRGIKIDYTIKKIDTKDPSLAHGGQ